MAGYNNNTQHRDNLTSDSDPIPRYESAVRYARNQSAAHVVAASIGGNSEVADGSNATGTERGVAVSLTELARKHRQAARRDRKRCQGQPGGVSTDTDNKQVTMETEYETIFPDTRFAHGAGGFSEPGGESGRLPRSPSQERVFVLTGSVADSSCTESRVTENIPHSAQTHDMNYQHPNHKNKKKLRWKEPGSEGDSCDMDDVFVSEVHVSGNGPCDDNSAIHVSRVNFGDGYGPRVSGVNRVSDNCDVGGVDGDKVSSAAQTKARVTAAVTSSTEGTKSRDLTTSTVTTCDPLSDIKVPHAQNSWTKTAGENEERSGIMDPLGALGIRKVPKLERQAAFSTATYSSHSSSEESDEERDSAVYNVDLIVKGQGHSGVSGGYEVDKKAEEEEDVYLPLWAVGNKVSTTTVQYKRDDTYVPIWTSNVPRNKRDVRTSRSMDDMLLEGNDLQGQGENKGERSPTVPKTMSLDIGANKTTNVILKDKIPQRTNRVQHQGQNGGQIRSEGQGQSSGSYDNNKNYNGRLSKLKLVYGAPDLDLPRVHNSAKNKDMDPEFREGQITESRPFEGQTLGLQVPSLLERRGILLKEASSADSEDRPPPLPIKHGRNLRSYEQLGRSLERARSISRSMSRSKNGSAKLNNGATWDHVRDTDLPPTGQKFSTPRDQLEDQSQRDQSAGPLQKLKRHLSRSKSYSLEHGDTASDRPPSEVAPRRHKNHFDLAIFTLCCCISPLGLVAVVLSVLADSWWREGEAERAHSYSRAALILCILGIITTVSLWSALLATNSLPFIKHVDVGEGGHQFSA